MLANRQAELDFELDWPVAGMSYWSRASNQLLLAGGIQKKISVRGSVTATGVSNQLHSRRQTSRTLGPGSPWPRMALPRTQFLIRSGRSGRGTRLAASRRQEESRIRSGEKFCLQSLVLALRWRRCLSRSGAPPGHAYRGRLYTLRRGRNARGEIVNVCYRLRPPSRTAGSGARLSMQTPRALAGCRAVHRDRLYVIGGNTAPSERWRKADPCRSSAQTGAREIFDPDSAAPAWEAGPSLPNLLCGAGVGKLSGCLRVIGGEDDKSWMAGECRGLTTTTDNLGRKAQTASTAAIMSTSAWRGCLPVEGAY
uniref:Uncharacterized protein n=1 Tax=Macrostomum lignano TaxID=282301 RepID=A0A1I8FBX3_9PLAT